MTELTPPPEDFHGPTCNGMMMSFGGPIDCDGSCCPATPPRDTTDTEALALAAKEHARHVAQYSTIYDGRGGIKWQDNGGMRCSCDGWEAPMDAARKVRPWDAWHAHVVAAVLATLATRDAALRAEALREAADLIMNMRFTAEFADWLRERADRIAERGGES